MAQQQKEEFYGAQTYYRELGYYISRLEQYERALTYFDLAIEKTPTNQRALVGRARARAKAVEYKGALEDLKKALENKPDDLVVLADKALNTYLSCEFEESLIQNLRNLPNRHKPDNFAMGVMHCTEAIENCVGGRAGRPLRDYYQIIRKLAWRKAKEEKKPYEARNKKKKQRKSPKKDKLGKALESINKKAKSCSLLFPAKSIGNFKIDPDLEIKDSLYSHKSEEEDIPPGPPFPYRPLQRYTTNIKNYMAEKYLDNMYLDKIFLKELKHTEGVNSPNVKGSEKIIKMARDGYKTLTYKQELLRTRRPFYYIKYQEGQISPTLKKRLELEFAKTQETASNNVEKLLESIKNCIKNKNTRTALELAEKLKVFCDSKPYNILPKKNKYFEELYGLLGKIFLDLKRLNLEQSSSDQEKRIYYMLGIPLSREPSKDSVLKQFKDVFIDYKKQIDLSHKRLQTATTLDEIAFLYHELSRYHIDLKQYELARIYGHKCMSEGYRGGNLDWVLNASMLLCRIDIQQHNRNDARTELSEALHIAKKINNNTLAEYIEKCLEVIEKLDFDEAIAAKIVKKREKQIVDMMNETQMKQDTSYLFRKMSAMPASRRMSIMPGIRFDDSSNKKKAFAKKMSIMPVVKKEDDEPISQKEKEKKGGVSFMEMIQYHVD